MTRSRPRDPFEGISPELRIEILSYLKPADLMAAIHASPSLYGAFAFDQRNLLEKAARNMLHRQTINDALSIVYCPRFEPGDDVKLPQEQQRDGVVTHGDLRFADFFRARDAQGFRFPTAIKDLHFLLRTIDVVENCLHSFACFVTKGKQESRLPGFNHWKPRNARKITGAEHVRLQRAFFRFELWSRLCGVLGPGLATGISSRLPANETPLLRGLTPLHEEELMCVAHYVQTQYEISLGELEFDFAGAYAAANKDMFMEPPRDPAVHPRDVEITEQNLPYFTHPCGMPSGVSFINMMPSLGLGFLRKFGRASSSWRRDFIRSTIGYTDFFRVGPSLIGSRRRTIGLSRITRADAGSNPLWTILQKQREYTGQGDVPQNASTNLRRLGWAIWDQKRLKSMKLWKSHNFMLMMETRLPSLHRLYPGLHCHKTIFSRNVWDRCLKDFQAQEWPMGYRATGQPTWSQRFSGLLEEVSFEMRRTKMGVSPTIEVSSQP